MQKRRGFREAMSNLFVDLRGRLVTWIKSRPIKAFVLALFFGTVFGLFIANLGR